MQKSKTLLLYSILISLAIAAVVENRVFYDLTAINDDVRNQIYWMARFIDPSYFSNDYIASYFTQSSMISPLLSWIYQFFSQWVNPKVVTQFLPFPIIALTTFCLFKATERHAGPKYAFWVSYIFNLYIWAMKFTAGGLSRSFFYLLFFLFLWILIAKRWNWLILCFALQALIYPTAFFISLITLIIEIIWTKIEEAKFDSTQIKATLISLGLGLPILYLRYVAHHGPNPFGHMTMLTDALKMPEFYLDGRVPIFIVPFNLSQEAFLKSLPYILIGLLIFGLAYYSLKKLINKRPSLVTMPRYIWSSSIASLILLTLGYMVLFYLYLPHRYIAYVLPLIPIFLAGTILYDIQVALPKRPLAIWLIAVLALLIAATRWNDDLIEVPKNEQQLYQFLKTIPNNALVAAPLRLASNIPAFSYRSVLISSETNIPFHLDYYKEVTSRTNAIHRIYNSNNTTEITNNINQYHIDYIVLDLKENGDSIVKNIPTNHIVFSNKRFIVMKSSNL